MDFTLSAYKQLISTLQSQGYFFQTFEEYIKNPKVKVIILRHDVDRLPSNALVIAKIEKEAGIKASYYFRIVKKSYDENIIKQIAEMGHEIGYHYENLSAVSSRKDFREEKGERRKAKGERRKEKLYELAIDDFERNLRRFRKLYPVKTICMHGSPLSKWDNRDLWKKYDYRDFGIIAEPYFDIDFDEVFYLTDTGRRWDGDRVSVRDKVLKKEDEKVRRLEGEKVRTLKGGNVEKRRSEVGRQRSEDRGQKTEVGCQKSEVKRPKKEIGSLRFRKTWDIIEAVENGLLPDKIMLNTHPQRWTDNPLAWTKELVWQNVKNVVKRIIIRRLR